MLPPCIDLFFLQGFTTPMYMKIQKQQDSEHFLFLVPDFLMF